MALVSPRRLTTIAAVILIDVLQANAQTAPHRPGMAKGSLGVFTNTADVPICRALGLSKELFDYAIRKDMTAYETMLREQGAAGICAMLPKGTLVDVMGPTSIGNLVEMIAPNGKTIYGPGMMFERAPYVSGDPTYPAQIVRCRRTLDAWTIGPLAVRVSYDRNGKIVGRPDIRNPPILDNLTAPGARKAAMDAQTSSMEAVLKCQPITFSPHSTGPIIVDYVFTAKGIE